MSVLREITLHAPRPPQEIQAALEREVMAVLAMLPNDARLTFSAIAKTGGVPFRLTLRFEAAHGAMNRYTLRFETHDASPAPAALESQRKALDAWFDLWTRHFTSDPGRSLPPESPDRYRELADQARQARERLTSVPSCSARSWTVCAAGGFSPRRTRKAARRSGITATTANHPAWKRSATKRRFSPSCAGSSIGKRHAERTRARRPNLRPGGSSCDCSKRNGDRRGKPRECRS
jgi:hypothetical protein